MSTPDGSAKPNDPDSTPAPETEDDTASGGPADPPD